MKYRAKVNFCGKISMSSGEIRDIADKRLAAQLLESGYIEAAEKEATRPAKSGAKGTKKNEDERDRQGDGEAVRTD